MCNGQGECALHPQGTACGATNCANGLVTGDVCDGAGACINAPSGIACFPYIICGSATECASSCASDNQCTASYHCDLSASPAVCVADLPDGSQCLKASECASGFCVDGVCCDTECSGQCEACNQPQTIGVCTAVTGDPASSHAACKQDPGGACSGTCDGANRQTCTYPGASTACGSTCTSGSVTASACDGNGSCVGGAPKSCGAYQCDSAGACRTTCSAESDCATGNVCGADHTCGPATSTCDGDHTVTHADGTTSDCSPYHCQASGTCPNSCTNSVDCLDGYLCADSACQATPAAPAADNSGCSCRLPASSRGARNVWPLALLGVGLLRRRRRARRRR